MGKKLDPWKLVFKNNTDFEKLVEKWTTVIDVLLPLHATLEPAIIGGLKSKESTQNATKQLRAMVTSLSTMYAKQLKPFADMINTDM